MPIPRCIQYRKIGTPLSLRVTLHFVSFIRSFISDGVSRHVSRLETVSRHGFLCLGLGSVLTLICLVLARVSSFHVSSCLMSHDCVFIVSLSGIATGKCLFCAETLAFLAESRPLGPFTCGLLTYCKMAVLVVVVFVS